MALPRRTYDNPDSQDDFLNEVETIGARREQRRYVDHSYPVDRNLRLSTQMLSQSDANPAIRKGFPSVELTQSVDTASSEEEEPAEVQRFQRSDSLTCSEYSDDRSWSNKNFVKRLINGSLDYDVNRTPYEMAETEEGTHPVNDHNNDHTDCGMAAPRMAKFRPAPDAADEWPKVSQQQHQPNGSPRRQKLVSEDRNNGLLAPPFLDEPHLEHAVPAVTVAEQRPQAHGKNGESGYQPAVKKGRTMQHQMKQPKTLAFAQQEPTVIDGRPALPLDAKKLQQQAASRNMQQKTQKNRRFPVDISGDGKKGKKVETVPETCRLHGVQWIENGTRRFLWHLGRRLTNVPALTVVIPLIVCTLSTIGVIIRRDSLRMETPFHTFYYPDPFEAASHGATGRGQLPPGDIFNASNARYDAFRRFGVDEGLEFAVVLKSEDHNVLDEEVIDSYLQLRKKIEDIKVVNDQKTFKYSVLCRRAQRDACPRDFVDTLMSSGKTIKFHYPETTVQAPLAKKDDGKETIANNSTTVFYLGNTFGGVETDQDGALAKAETLAMYFKLKQPAKGEIKETTGAGGMDVLRAWDEEFQLLMRGEELAHSRGKAGSVSWWSHGAFVTQVLSTFNNIYIYLSASLGVFAVGCLIVALKGNSYSVKPGLGVAAAVTVFLVVGGGWCVEIGITGYVNPAVFPAFFFIAATALHFMVNTLQSWRKYCMIAMDPGERIRIILSWESPCLLWCCLIIGISCMITAAVVAMPFYRSICQLLAASSILIIFLVLLLFVGVMYISGKREMAGFKWFHCGKITAEFPPPLIRRYHKRDVEILQKKMRNEQQQLLRSLGEFAANVNARYVALLVFCIYLIFAAWGCSLAPIKINEGQYIRSSTNLNRFLNEYSQYYGKYDNYLVLTFRDSVDYFDNRIRSAILDMLAWVEMQEHVAERTVSWLREFTEFEKSSIYLINHDTFVPVVDLIFLKDGSPYQQFSTDIAFGRYREQIIASRMYIELNPIGMQRQLEIVKTLTAKAAEAGLPMSVWSPSAFLLQHDIQLAASTITTMAILIGIIAVLTLIVFAQPYLTLLTVLTTCSVAAGTIGFAALWDAPLNALNAGAVLAAVAHSAALCISCCYHYGNSGDVTAVRRMAVTFQSWLPGALWSSIVGLAAFAPLLFVECQIIQHLAKIVLCHFLSIMVHVSVFLPPCLVLLTTSVPSCCRLMKRMCEDSFCVCCSSDEDATSIYYIPTGGRQLDPVYVQQFYQLKFREDILPPPPVHPLPPPPVREMLMPPPPRGPPSSVAGSATAIHMQRPMHEHRCVSPQHVMESRHHSAANSMQRQGSRAGGPTAKVYRYGSNATDFEDIMRARSARAAMNKRYMGPNMADPGHHPRAFSPDVASPQTRRHRAAASPIMEPRQRHNSEEIYHEPSDPDTMSMRTTNTNADYNKHSEAKGASAMNASSSPPGAAVDSGDEEGMGRGKMKSMKPYETRLVESDNGNGAKSKITYAKWSKEIPLDPFTTERVTAEKYTIEGDGGTIDLPPDWKRFWIKGNLRGQALPGPNAVPPDMAGMAPHGDHHMHHHPQPMPMPGLGPGQHYRPPPNVFHPPTSGPGPMGDGAPMMPPYMPPPPLPNRPPQFGLPRASGPNGFRGQHPGHFRKTPAWMY